MLSQGGPLVDNATLVGLGIIEVIYLSFTLSIATVCRLHLTLEVKLIEEVGLRRYFFLPPLVCRRDCYYPLSILKGLINVNHNV